ncbi:MAG: HAD-IIIC family phosphatase [Gammaproteobacteria bacterium]
MLKALRHLPHPPVEFRQLCRTASEARQLVALANHALDGAHLAQLAKAHSRLKQAGGDFRLTPFRLGILCNATTDFMAPALTASALRYGIDLTIVTGSYGQVLQEALNSESALYGPPCDAALLALDHRGLPMMIRPGPDHGAQVDSALEFISQIRVALKHNSNATIMFQTVPSTPESLFGGMDSVIHGTQRALINDFNSGLRRLVRNSPGDVIVDVEALANSIGLLNWHAPKEWNLAKVQFAQNALPLWADAVARSIAALRGRTRKCLVLDLDNTLWGGAVGDLGVSGIELGNGTALGEAFLDVQKAALHLRDRGVVLAVCSKNDEIAALQPFTEHPEMLIRREHISVFQANWFDKATNLEAIARALDIGLESLVLLDDNPAERALVRQALPEVAVPELPDDPSEYARVLLNAGYFDAVAFSAEDAVRADHYAANAQRSALKLQSRDLGHFLASLDMVAKFAPFDAAGRGRIAQLINKTNQFNLTTRRYTETQVEAFECDPTTWTLQVRLIDRFGDNGMISVVICRPLSSSYWEIDTWLMSCRVLGRRLEEAVLNEIVTTARKADITKLIGRYLPSGKNNMVVGHYARLGFIEIGTDDGASMWALDVEAYKPKDVPIRVVHSAASIS